MPLFKTQWILWPFPFYIFEECYEKEKNGLVNEESRLHRDSFFICGVS